MESYPSVEGKFFFYQCSKKLLPKTKLYILASRKKSLFFSNSHNNRSRYLKISMQINGTNNKLFKSFWIMVHIKVSGLFLNHSSYQSGLFLIMIVSNRDNFKLWIKMHIKVSYFWIMIHIKVGYSWIMIHIKVCFLWIMIHITVSYPWIMVHIKVDFSKIKIISKAAIPESRSISQWAFLKLWSISKWAFLATWSISKPKFCNILVRYFITDTYQTSTDTSAGRQWSKVGPGWFHTPRPPSLLLPRSRRKALRKKT